MRWLAIDATERLQRVLAARGVGSRRHAEELIRQGRVTVDGRPVTKLGVKVDPRTVTLRVDGKLLRPQALRYVMLNKPGGYITTTSDERGRRTVMELVPASERLYPVGRLDRDTEGLLLLTNDGEVANRVMHPRYGLAKEYEILTPGQPTERVMQRVRDGVMIDDRRVVPDAFRVLRQTRAGVLLKVVVHEGINRVVRRMMEAVGIPVKRLRRVRVGPLSLAGIPEGGWRELTAGERATLLEALRLERDVDYDVARKPRSPRPRPAGGRSGRAARPAGGDARPARWSGRSDPEQAGRAGGDHSAPADGRTRRTAPPAGTDPRRVSRERSGPSRGAVPVPAHAASPEDASNSARRRSPRPRPVDGDRQRAGNQDSRPPVRRRGEPPAPAPRSGVRDRPPERREQQPRRTGGSDRSGRRPRDRHDRPPEPIEQQDVDDRDGTARAPRQPTGA